MTEPIGPQHIDRNIYGMSMPKHDVEWNKNARVAPEQKIVDTIWAPPAMASYGHTHVTQAFGHVNWNQFGASNFETHFDTGHSVRDTPMPTSYEAESSYSRARLAGRVSDPKPAPAPKGPKKGPRPLPGQLPLID